MVLILERRAHQLARLVVDLLGQESELALELFRAAQLDLLGQQFQELNQSLVPFSLATAAA